MGRIKTYILTDKPKKPGEEPTQAEQAQRAADAKSAGNIAEAVSRAVQEYAEALVQKKKIAAQTLDTPQDSVAPGKPDIPPALPVTAGKNTAPDVDQTPAPAAPKAVSRPAHSTRKPSVTIRKTEMHRPAAPAEDEQAKSVARTLADTSLVELERLRRIIDMLPCYVMIIDGEHRIHFHNKAFVDFFGEPSAVPGQDLCHSVLRGSPDPCRFCPPLDTLNSGTNCVMEWVYAKTKHAFRVYSYPFSEENGRRLLLKVGFNVTANVRVQQALDLSEQSYRAITDNLSIGIAMLNLDLSISAGNSRLGIWFGQEFARGRRICEVLQCNGYQHIPEKKDEFCADCPFKAAIADGASHEKEFTVAFLDGAERNVRLVACPVAPRRGGVRALIMMLEDITNRLRVNQQLQRVRKLEAMGTLAGGIAHEINQPLSALHLYASGLQMLLEKQNEVSAETTQERLGLIMREAEKIRSIITHMRSLVMQEGKVTLEAVDLLAVLRNTLLIMENQIASRGIELLLDLPEALPPVHSNAVQLEQVLVNLIGNAVHALDSLPQEDAGDSSPASLAGREGQAPSDAGGAPARKVISIAAELQHEGTRVVIEVADSGPGLPKGSDRIFDPFYTTKDAHKGLGLGLSIVHGLVSLWGGEVHARPHHPTLGGATFYVELPVELERKFDEEE